MLDELPIKSQLSALILHFEATKQLVKRVISTKQLTAEVTLGPFYFFGNEFNCFCVDSIEIACIKHWSKQAQVYYFHQMLNYYPYFVIYNQKNCGILYYRLKSLGYNYITCDGYYIPEGFRWQYYIQVGEIKCFYIKSMPETIENIYSLNPVFNIRENNFTKVKHICKVDSYSAKGKESNYVRLKPIENGYSSGVFSLHSIRLLQQTNYLSLYQMPPNPLSL
jgi:hypothetical protein